MKKYKNKTKRNAGIFRLICVLLCISMLAGCLAGCGKKRETVIEDPAVTEDPGKKEEIIEKMNELAAKRREKQPLTQPSAGSAFKRPEGAYAAALIYVGILMMECVKDIQWTNPSVALPSFLTLVMMPFTYNISYGIAFGLVAHVIIRICIGKIKEVSVGTWIITALFAAMFFLTH